MNSMVGGLAFLILLAVSSEGSAQEIDGQRSIQDGLVSGIDIPISAIGLSSGIAMQALPQSIAIQVPHPVAVPVPHPIVVPVDRPVPFPVDRPVPYPVPIIKNYFIPVPLKVRKPVPLPLHTPKKPHGSESKSGPGFGDGSKITTESYRIYSNGLGGTDPSSRTRGYNAVIEVSTTRATKSARSNSSFQIHVN